MRDFLTMSNSYRQHEFKDKIIESEIPKFKHSWTMMAHMHDLRVWTLAYAPSTKNNLQRLQEIHRLNAEMWYGVSQSIYKRIFVLIAFYFFVNKIAKERYAQRLINYDS